jgi:hypothetical protein
VPRSGPSVACPVYAASSLRLAVAARRPHSLAMVRRGAAVCGPAGTARRRQAAWVASGAAKRLVGAVTVAGGRRGGSPAKVPARRKAAAGGTVAGGKAAGGTVAGGKVAGGTVAGGTVTGWTVDGGTAAWGTAAWPGEIVGGQAAPVIDRRSPG